MKDPTIIFQEAIEELEALVQQDTDCLDIEANGKLIATRVGGMQKALKLTRSFIVSLFSSQEHEHRHQQIKKKLLNLRDTVQTYTAMIHMLEHGNPTQQKFANRAREVIQRFNAFVSKESKSPSWSSRYAFHYERNLLLLDEAIRGKPIRLPLVASIKYESHPSAQKTLRDLSESLSLAAAHHDCTSLHPTPKKMNQVLVDVFRMKAIRKIQEHLPQHNSALILGLLKQTPLEINESSSPEVTWVRQVLELAPGAVLTLLGSFRKPSPTSKLMSIPILVDLHLTFESTQTGFPHPSQYVACAFDDSIVDANPLRPEQVPLFAKLEKRKKQVAQELLFDSNVMAKSKQIFKWNQEAFDRAPRTFLDLHRKLFQSILEAAPSPLCSMDLLDRFYTHVESARKPFDVLVSAQQQLIAAAFIEPAKRLQEAWLKGDSLLRLGTPHEKFQVASKISAGERERTLANLGLDNPVDLFSYSLGQILGEAGQALILQHMSEKIGFPPPVLNDFERKIQLCAFQQLIDFLDELKGMQLEQVDKETYFINKLQRIITVFQSPSLSDIQSPALELIHELENYFHVRFVV